MNLRSFHLLPCFLTFVLFQTQLMAACDLPMFAGARLFPAGRNGTQAMTTGDFNGDGLTDLAVVNNSDGNISILLGNGDGTFQPAVNYPVAQPSDIVTADFNGDGTLDLAVWSSYTTVVLLGNGDGTFQAAFTASNQGGALAVGDFNADGKPDLAIVGLPVYLLLGKGDGTFQPPIAPDGNSFLASFGVAVGDFNGDGYLDAITGSLNGGFYLTLGNGAGNLSAPVEVSTGTGAGTMRLAAGDFNGDHLPDVVTLSPSDGNLNVFLGNGDGTFQPATQYNTGGLAYFATGLLVTDLNNDGLADMAVVTHASLTAPGTIVVFSGNGDGTFQPPATYNPTAQADWALAAADLNRDGLPDLIFSSIVQNVPGQIGVMLGNPNGTFQSPQGFATGELPRSPVLADLNGDGVPDLIVANAGFTNGRSISVLIANGDGTFQAAVNYPTAFGAKSVAVGDFNGDGKLDLIVANGTGSNVLVFPGNGDGTFQTPRASGSLLGGAVYVAVGDFNRDGKLDAAIVSLIGSVSILTGNGDGTFRGSLTVSGPRPGYSAGPLTVADLNGDGKLDIVYPGSDLEGTTSLHPGIVSVILGKGDGTFGPVTDYPVGAQAVSVAAGDLNADGLPDLAVADYSKAGTIAILLGNGDGTFQPAVKYAVGSGSSAVVMNDFDGDGVPDLAVSSSPGDTVTILLGNGDGTFRNPMTYGAGGGGTLALAAADLNRDGQPDLAIVDDGANAVFVLLNNNVPGGGSACVTVAPVGN